MNIQNFKNQLQETVIVPMTEFMNDCEDCGFTQKDIAKCEALILEYVVSQEKTIRKSEWFFQ